MGESTKRFHDVMVAEQAGIREKVFGLLWEQNQTKVSLGKFQ